MSSAGWVAYETTDDEIRARWLQRPVMAELVALAGAWVQPSGDGAVAGEVSEEEADLLRRVMSGQTSNKEIALGLGLPESEVARRSGPCSEGSAPRAARKPCKEESYNASESTVTAASTPPTTSTWPPPPSNGANASS